MTAIEYLQQFAESLKSAPLSKLGRGLAADRLAGDGYDDCRRNCIMAELRRRFGVDSNEAALKRLREEMPVVDLSD